MVLLLGMMCSLLLLWCCYCCGFWLLLFTGVVGVKSRVKVRLFESVVAVVVADLAVPGFRRHCFTNAPWLFGRGTNIGPEFRRHCLTVAPWFFGKRTNIGPRFWRRCMTVAPWLFGKGNNIGPRFRKHC